MLGFIHAHTGWLFARKKANHHRYAQDLLDDPVVAAVSRQFRLILALSYFVIPFALGLAITGRLVGGLETLLWGGVLRVFFFHHATWSVNSVCHMWGKSPFKTRDCSTNNKYLALLQLGEGWHHNHHAFPWSAKFGLLRWQFDPTWCLIWALEKLGLVWNVQRVAPEGIEGKKATS